jgi:beta-lactam-binding protein with PASTA domain
MNLRSAAASAALSLVLVGCAPSPALAFSSWLEEATKKNAEEVAKKAAEREAQEREAAAHHATEEAEHQQKAKEEEAQHAANEAAERERQAKETEAAECVVPSVAGDSLNAASNSLRKAHCQLGKVTRPHNHNGPVVVIKQSYKRGTRLAPGATVAVSLGAKPRRGH